MAIKKQIFGIDNYSLTGHAPKISQVSQAYFLFDRDGRQTDVYGPLDAMAVLCLEIVSQHPELAGYRIGKPRSAIHELLKEEEIIQAAAGYMAGKNNPSLFFKKIKLSSLRKISSRSGAVQSAAI